MNIRSLLTIEQLMDYVNTDVVNIDSLYEHYHNGTIDQFYQSMINTVVTALMMIPINRFEQNLDPGEENDGVSKATEEIADTVSTMCNKPLNVVQADIIEAVKQFPASDVREATSLRHANRLN